MSTSSFVLPGGCFLGSQLIYCALEQSHCNGLTFLSHREIEAIPSAYERCKKVEDVQIGMCTSNTDYMHCTSDPSNCVISDRFLTNSPYCSIKFNHYPERNSPFALYGLCSPGPESTANGLASSTCVWSMDSCPVEYSIFTPASQVDPDFGNSLDSSDEDDDSDSLCTCNKVRTGACRYGSNDFICAVSPDACSAEASFVNWQRLQSAYQRTCYLCSDLPTHSKIETYTGTWSAVGFCSTSRRWGLRLLFVGIVVGLALAVGLMPLISVYKRKRRAGKTNQNNSNDTTVDSVKEVEMEKIPEMS